MWLCCSARCAFWNFFSRAAPPALRAQHTEDRIFRCQKCGYVYTDDADVDRSRCSQCGKLNEPIVF